MKKILISTAIILAFSSNGIEVHAASTTQYTIVRKDFGCITKDQYDRLLRFGLQGDKEAFVTAGTDAIAAGRCILFNPGDTVYLDVGEMFSGMVKVRPQGSSTSYWTAIETVQQKK